MSEPTVTIPGAPAPAPDHRPVLVVQRFTLTVKASKGTAWNATHTQILAALKRSVELYTEAVTCGPLPLVELAKVEHTEEQAGWICKKCRRARTTMNAISLMKMAGNIKSRRHFRMVRGKFEKAVARLSPDLRASALREFKRRVPANLPY